MVVRRTYYFKDETPDSRQSFADSLVCSGKKGISFIAEYSVERGIGRVYHVCRCTAKVNTNPLTHPVSLTGNSSEIPFAVSKLEKISGCKLEDIRLKRETR